jgi:hypothetical protein
MHDEGWEKTGRSRNPIEKPRQQLVYVVETRFNKIDPNRFPDSYHINLWSASGSGYIFTAMLSNPRD